MALPDRFNDRKLREESLRAFVKALHTDRMIAVTGAMTTRALGYPSWKEFSAAYGQIAHDLAAEIYKTRGEADKDLAARSAGKLLDQIMTRGLELARGQHAEGADLRVPMWVLHDSFRTLDRMMRQLRSGLVIDNTYQKPALERFERRLAALFRSRTHGHTSPLSPSPAEAALRPLIESLGIRRFATLNYDFEIERALMLRDDERDILRRAERENLWGPLEDRDPATLGSTIAGMLARKAAVDRKRETDPARGAALKQGSVAFFIGDQDSGKPIVRLHRNQLRRTMGNGIDVSSDVIDSERPDRLFEFGIGASDLGRHIIHLHGRADAPDSMVANLRQYDRLYRRDDLNRDPFDHGLRVLFGGNPVVFVGLGMTEPELNQYLQYFVSNSPIRRPAPAFLIWNTNDIDPAKREAYKIEFRLDMRTRLGIHVLFDEDILQPGDEQWLADLAVPAPAAAETAMPQSDAEARASLAALRMALASIREMPDPSGGGWEMVRLRADAAVKALDAAPVPSPPAAPAPGAGGEQTGRTRLKLQALAQTIAKLPALVTRVDRRLDRHDEWRTIEVRLDAPKGPFRLYGSQGLKEYVGRGLAQERTTGRLSVPAWPAGTVSQNPSAQAYAPVIFATAPSGSGRGAFGEQLVQLDDLADVAIGDALLHPTECKNRLMVNAGFSYDSDTMLIGIASFLRRRVTQLPSGSRARERLFVDGALFRTNVPTLIVINGVDRFFSLEGVPLSAELDHMLRCALRPGAKKLVQLVLLGTDRLKRYGETIGVPLQQAIAVPPDDASKAAAPVAPAETAPEARAREVWEHPTRLEAHKVCLQSSYLEWVASRFSAYRKQGALHLRKKAEEERVPAARLESQQERLDITASSVALIERAIQVERESLPRAFFEAYLSPALLQALGIDCAAAFEILRTICFIGGPVEAGVLIHAPKVRAILAEDSNAPRPGTETRRNRDLPGRLMTVVSALRELGLLIQLEPHEEPADATKIDRGMPPGWWTRYGLHRSLATFLRDRHGAPINDAKLATTFNMSLFMSEPSDNYTPQPDFHEELADLVDHLIGGWHDLRHLYPYEFAIDTSEADPALIHDLYIASEDIGHARESLSPRSGRAAAACLRCALSLVRNYYSTGALLKLDREDRFVTPERDGALTEHAHRLERLINAYGDVSIARKIVRSHYEKSAEKALAEAQAKGESNHLAAIAREWEVERRCHMGPDPFYADDLVWLHNERGVVALTQGHMFDARDAFSAANTVNNKHVEAGYNGHNWRRIAINRIATRIERGMLQLAEKLLDEVEASVNAAPWCAESAGRGSRVDAIRRAHKSRPLPICGNVTHTREEILVVGMATGYRGLIAHMRGQYPEGREHYEIALDILRRLGEHRALAHFRRHFASLQSFIGEKALAVREIEFAINSAQSAKQMDILHRARVVRANLWRQIHTDAVIRRQALQDVKDALQYAAHSDCYRVRIEASASLARHMRESGDYDTALHYAVDALMIASRYGHSLQKTALRIEIGQILKARGDPMSGDAMLDRAIAIGTNKGYHLALALERVRSARNVLAANPPLPNRTDIPIAR